MPTNFPPPVNVSPLIRFGRYSMLLVGIGYGAFWQSRYTKKELALKDIKAKEKAARDARIAQEKAMRSADEDFIVVPKEIEKGSYAVHEKYDKPNLYPNDSARAEQSDRTESADAEPEEVANKERLTNRINILESNSGFLFKSEINSEDHISNNNIMKGSCEKKRTVHNTKEKGFDIPIMEHENIFDSNISILENVVKDIDGKVFRDSKSQSDKKERVNKTIFDTPEIFNKDTVQNSTEVDYNLSPLNTKNRRLLNKVEGDKLIISDQNRGKSCSSELMNNDKFVSSEEDRNIKSASIGIPGDNYVDFLFTHGPS